MRASFLFIIVFLLWSNISYASILTDVRLANRGEGIRIVMEFKKPLREYKVFTLTNPERVVVDMVGVQSMYDVNSLDLTGLPVKAVRLGVNDKQSTRLVVELTQKGTITSFTLTDPWRLVIDVSLPFLQPIPSKPVRQVEPIQKQSLRPVVVVIDPGHGGRDPGAIGPAGTREKDVVLAIALELAKALQKEYGIRAVLTRNTDQYINLRERLEIARKSGADIFVAIHADAFKNPQANGASVYTLSLRGASSEAAKWLAEKENYSELSGISLTDKDDLLRSVLIDLAQTATIDASLRLGQLVLTELGKTNHLHRKQVEQAAFMVLRSPDIPSILIETGFISHRQEEQKLRDVFHQRKLVQAIKAGILRYIHQYPIPGTWLAAGPVKEHIVKRGDTLSSIATLYKTSIIALKQVNELSSDTIRVGQKLIIPSL